jgi:hypothetical protein
MAHKKDPQNQKYDDFGGFFKSLFQLNKIIRH